MKATDTIWRCSKCMSNPGIHTLCRNMWHLQFRWNSWKHFPVHSTHKIPIPVCWGHITRHQHTSPDAHNSHCHPHCNHTACLFTGEQLKESHSKLGRLKVLEMLNIPYFLVIPSVLLICCQGNWQHGSGSKSKATYNKQPLQHWEAEVLLQHTKEL